MRGLSNAPTCCHGRAQIPPRGVLTFHGTTTDFAQGIAQKVRQQLLWQEFFCDPTRWWDVGPRDESSSPHLDFWRKSCWIDTRHKLAGVDLQLSNRMRVASGSKASPNSDYGAWVWTETPSRADLEIDSCCGLSEAVEALDILVQRRCHIDNSLFFSVLKKCIVEKDLMFGRRVHALALKCGYESNAFLSTHIIRMYACHNKLEEATQVFSRVSLPNTHVWASIILAHAQLGQPIKAIQFYRQMKGSAVKPNHHIFVGVLKACAVARDLVAGMEIHVDILEGEVGLNVYVGSSLVDMYSKCGSLEQARTVFEGLQEKNVVTWNAMIGGYAQQGFGEEAIALHTCMLQDSAVSANPITYVCLLQACVSVGALHVGEQVHAQIQQRGLEGNVTIGNSLVNMYAKCGSLEDARRVFDRLPRKDVVTWNAMITGFAQYGLGTEALAFYRRMQSEGITRPDQVTFVCLLQACASAAALQKGKQLHAQIRERGLEGDMVIGNSLVHMYAKCGSIENAHNLFDRLPTRDVVTWNALLNGYAEYGNGRMAIQCFTDMLRQHVKPDGTTFISLLVACCHEGMVAEGQQYFNSMVQDHAITPTIYHYTCLVDLLGRAGHLDEAEDLLHNMPFKNAVAGWKSLLSACKSYGEVELGRRCFDYLVSLEPENGAAYVLMASMYAAAGSWKDVDEIEALKKSAGASKKPAKASIEVQNHVHDFIVGEAKEDVTRKLKSITSRWKEGGYVPHTELVLKAGTFKEKEDTLCGHAEKLALAFGLLNTPDGTALLVTKNLRMCNDCHSSTKVMSRLEKREIIVRDAHRLHRFVDGSCSCKERT